MEVTIDRFEGDYAVVEIDVGEFVSIPKVLVPDAKEGDIIEIRINKEKTEHQKEKITNLMNSLFED